MSEEIIPQVLADVAARTIFDGFLDYRGNFTAITRRAPQRFESRDWHAAQSDAVERLDLYAAVIDATIRRLNEEVLIDHSRDISVWRAIRIQYEKLISTRHDLELAETFFNSVSRRMFTTIGVNQSLEFLASDFDGVGTPDDPPFCRTYQYQGDMNGLMRQILLDYSHSLPYQDLDEDAGLAAKEIIQHLQAQGLHQTVGRLEILQPVFYRNKGAYIVGRIRAGLQVKPLVIALRHPSSGIQVDAVLLTDDEVSIVFSFTRSYFHVEVENPHKMINFLKTIMPIKRIAELYISIGFNKHGKTELYRELMSQLERTQDRFVTARGEKGMVMVVFTMPSFDMVFKVIRDRFDEPKTTSREAVKNKYRLVFRHDRAGRLVDAQEFEYLTFSIQRFSPELLVELQQTAGENVLIQDDQVVIRHLYTERRMTPLDLFVREGPEDAVKEAVLDYGQSIKDLAATDIFPGDILLKNFGVTRHGRVVFYDYDELIPVTECKFRRFPKAQSMDDEMQSEPWFYVDRNDIFPEEFETFLGLNEPYRSAFVQTHGDLFGIEFWRRMQKIHKNGEIIDIFPYKQSKRFHPEQE